MTYRRPKIHLRNVIGACVVAVEHSGSTAVPGLAAKPTLDVDVVVSGLRDIHEASEALTDAGFEARGFWCQSQE